MTFAGEALAQSRLRQALVVALVALLFLSATGVVAQELFSLPSTLKYAITLAGPLLILSLVVVDRPLYLAAAATVFAVPFALAQTHFAGTHISVMIPVLILGFFLMFTTERLQGRRPSLALPAVFVFPFFALPLLEGANSGALIDSLVMILAVGAVVSRVAAEKDGLRVILWSVVAQVAFQSAIAIWNAKTGHQLNLYGGAGSSSYGSNYSYQFAGVTRPTGTFNDPIGLANGIAFTIPMMLGLFMTTRGRLQRLIIAAVTAETAVAVAYALDRASWIGLVLGMLVMILLLPPAVRRRSLPWFLLGAAVAVGGILAIEGSAVISKFDSIFHPTRTTGLTAAEKGIAAGEVYRTQAWGVALRDGFLAHPLAGVGIDKIGAVILNHLGSSGVAVNGVNVAANENAASTYLQLLADAGLLGASVFLSLFYALYRDIGAALRRYPVVAAGLAGAVVVLLVCWGTDVVVLEQLPVAGTVGILFGTVAGAGWRHPERAEAQVSIVTDNAIEMA